MKNTASCNGGNLKMKKILLFTIIISILTFLCGCGHEHTFKEATCTEPKTCTECGATEGEPLGHTWAEATCTEAKTCKTCGKTEGEPLGHNWMEATCTEAKTCKICGMTEGYSLGHSTEMGKCKRCGTIIQQQLSLDVANATGKITEIENKISDLIAKVDGAKSIDVYYTYFDTAESMYFDKFKSALDELITLCGSHSEMSKMKKAAQNLKNSLPGPVSNNLDSLQLFLSDWSNVLYNYKDLIAEEMSFIKRFTD